ncbi:acyl carrier protein [Kitasatospora sp. NPDC096077]|uniref:acyl carrier protein n=1 Tax=Kitasatospora sp. NPDC096077 TaxID=3155544 RepID=UPI003332B67D
MSFDELKSVLVSLGLDPAVVEPDTAGEDAGVDSLLIVELVLQLRKEYGVVVSADDIRAAPTLAAVAELICVPADVS